ncbi:MAG: PKD domain-containing protein, partial [Candidatus Aminicenantes bacterium]|nr:PKD domain-containing protein [Candidatus Aminicenantes bacterium]
MYYHIYNQEKGTWTGPQKATQRVTSSAYPQIAEDLDGNLHMTYMDGNASSVREIYYAKFNFAQYEWKPKKLAYQSSGVNSSWPRIELDHVNNKIYIVWSHNYASNVGVMDLVMIENDLDGLWPVDSKSRITVSDTSQSVSVHGDFAYRDGNAYAVWMDDLHKSGNWNIYFGEGKYNNAGNSWSFGKYLRMGPSDVNQYYPAIAVDDAGNLHVLYSFKNNPMWYTRRAGEKWEAPKAISNGGTDQNMFAVLIYKQGLLHSLWRQGTDIYYGRALPDGTWTEPVKVVDGQFPGYPNLDIDVQGNVHATWSDGDADHPRNVFYTKIELPGEPPQAVAEADPVFGLIPVTVKFNGSKSSDPDGRITDYRWSFGDGSVAQGKKVEHTYKKAGEFLATLTVIDNDLRTNTDQILITASTGAPVAKIQVSANTGMRPLTVAFDASESEDVDGEIISYRWEYGDGAIDDGVQVTHVYENGGDYIAKLVVTDNEGKTGVATETIDVYQPPVAIFTAEPTYGKPPLVVKFDGSDSYDEDGEIKTYKWDFGDGLTALSKKTNHTYGTPGTFTARLTAVDDDNYTGTASQEIQVLDRPLAPVNVALNQMFNRSLFYVAFINEVNWANHPGNADLYSIASFRIYRKPKDADDSQFTMLAEVSGTETQYADRGFKNREAADAVVYTVTAVDSDGNESELSDTTR